jgi:hypothetical protein
VEAAVAGADTAYERDIARDLVKHGLLAAPFAVGLGALLRGRAGAVGVRSPSRSCS